jgi:uncharacterized protein YbjT (DUF2867 family)
MGLIVIAGGHGQIALQLIPLLVQQGHEVRGLIRNPDHAGDLEELGAEAAVCDMEGEPDLDQWVDGADAVVFAAGAGPGSGPERKQTVDLGAAVKLIDACRATGVERYLMISAISAADPESGPESMRPYLRAKADADRALRDSGLAYTIVRPGRLTDEPGTGLVQAAERLERGDIPRADVAATLAQCVDLDFTAGATFDLVSGPIPISDALRALRPRPG